MWDVGSLILATVSARKIGLISEKAFDARVKGILQFLERLRFNWGGAQLPNFRTDVRSGRSVEFGYDSTDMGRLFVALHVLDRATAGSYRIARLVGRWNIEATIDDGALFDVKSSRRLKSEAHNYLYYVARAHRLWSLDVNRGYDGALDDPASRAAFLDRVTAVGAIASEPAINEIIEIGTAPHAEVLTATLRRAQQQRYAETGQLTCVSEAPIDKKPWFTYQGFDPNSSGTFAWPVHSVVTEKRWQTEEFANRFRMVNTKAAYMWYALGDDDYTRKLRDYAGTEARTQHHGFKPGIYERSGRTPRLMDINTNAMVLQAIAYIANGRQPLATIRL